MRVHILAVGRMKSGPEAILVSDYQTRFNRTGRALGLGPMTVVEVDDRKGGGQMGEATALRAAMPKGAMTVALDERGKVMTSPEFAKLLAKWRDQGCRDLAFLIGGADGLAPDLRDGCDHAISFGKMVWPHMLARAMLAEQLYRGAGILAGSPYHRV